jgi:hypothetical protein
MEQKLHNAPGRASTRGSGLKEGKILISVFLLNLPFFYFLPSLFLHQGPEMYLFCELVRVVS